MASVQLVFKGKAVRVEVESASALFDAAVTAFDFGPEVTIKLLSKGKALQRDGDLTTLGSSKVMVMATGGADLRGVQAAKSDPTVRGFAEEDRAAAQAKDEERSTETNAWGVGQNKEYRFCRLEACTWQSFGTRPSSRTPHAFAAPRLLLQLACDPGISGIMVARRWVVGTLAEMDPVDDRLKEKMEGSGHTRLLGYNMNAGAQIHIRLRTHDLSGFLDYPALVDTLLHELAHNEVGPHNEQFWHLFAQLKADYLRHHKQLAATGQLFAGQSPLAVAGNIAGQARDVRTAVIAALERDRQVPAEARQIALLDGYLQATDSAAGHPSVGAPLGGVSTSPPVAAAPSRDELRNLLAARADERRAAGGGAAAADCNPSTEGEERHSS